MRGWKVFKRDAELVFLIFVTSENTKLNPRKL